MFFVLGSLLGVFFQWLQNYVFNGNQNEKRGMNKFWYEVRFIIRWSYIYFFELVQVCLVNSYFLFFKGRE